MSYVEDSGNVSDDENESGTPIVSTSIQTGQQGTLITHPSEYGDETKGSISLIENIETKENEKLREENEKLRKENEKLRKENENLKKENEILKKQIGKEPFDDACAVGEEEEFQFGPTAYPRQLLQDAQAQNEEVEINTSFQASSDCKHYCNIQYHSSQVPMQKEHQMFIKSTTDSIVMCNQELYHKKYSKYQGDGVLMAIMGPPCKTNALPSESIIFKHEANKIVQPTDCESLLLEIAHERAPNAKFCVVKTTYDSSNMLVNPGVTANTLHLLTTQWKKNWKTKFQTFIVMIPYGGKYKMDEEMAINEAIKAGIIIVAASGCDKTGITFPAKLGAVICVGATQCDYALASFSPKGKELDCVGCGSWKLGNVSLVGTGISTIVIGTDIALLFQHLFCTNKAIFNYITHYVLRELLEMTIGNLPVTGNKVMSIIDIQPLAVRSYVEHIIGRRDRIRVDLEPFKTDSDYNTMHWSSKYLNDNYTKRKKKWIFLSGKKIKITIIDEVEKEFLDHMKNVHNRTVHKEAEIQCLVFDGKMLSNECCKVYIKADASKLNANKAHAVQCAAIIANTAPDCYILLIIPDDIHCPRAFEDALKIVKEQEIDILLLSSVVIDYMCPKYLQNINDHLHCRVVLCAAGNEGKCDRTSTICYPSRAGDVIVIGACDRYGNRCPYSSCGKQVDFLCPGQFSIADNSGKGGTCYSTSAAAAFIALVLEYIDNLNADASIEVYSKNNWKKCHPSKLARNTHLMRALLSSRQLPLCFHTDHVINDGFGMLQIDNLVLLTPDGIIQVMADFHI